MLMLDARYLRQPRSGIPRYAVNLLRAVRAADPGRRVRVLVPAGDALPGDLATHPALDPVVDTASPRDPRDLWRWPTRLRRLDASVVHCPDAFAPLRCPVPVAITLHDLIPLICRDGLPRSRKQRVLPLWRRWLKLQTRRADAVITVSQHSADDLHRLLGISPTKTHVIPNAVPPPPPEVCEAAPNQSAVDPLNALGLRPWVPAPEGLGIAPTSEQNNPPARYVLCVGRFDPYKNVPGLIEAFARLIGDQASDAEASALKLILVGPPDDRYPQARDIATRLNLEDRVVFTGEVTDEQLERLYRHAALLVMPSLYEGFGLPAVEAMRRGVPVVVSDRGSLPEVVGDAALVVDATDPAALAAGMRRVLDNPAMAGDLVERGHAQARRYDPAAIGTRYLELIDRLTYAGRHNNPR